MDCCYKMACFVIECTLQLSFEVWDRVAIVTLKYGGRLNINMPSYQYRDHLNFNIGIPIPGKDGLYNEMGPWSRSHVCHYYVLWNTVLTRPTLECRVTLDHLRSINPNMIDHFTNQSLTYQLLEILKSSFFNIEKKTMKSGTISGTNNYLHYLLIYHGNVNIFSQHVA